MALHLRSKKVKGRDVTHLYLVCRRGATRW